MQTLRFPTRVIVMFAVFAPVLWASPAFSGEADTLQQAIQLFEQGSYDDAHELLLGIDRDKLNDEQKTLRDDYLGRAEVAGNMYGKALRDFEDAETAIEVGDMDDARASSRLFWPMSTPVPGLPRVPNFIWTRLMPARRPRLPRTNRLRVRLRPGGRAADRCRCGACPCADGRGVRDDASRSVCRG